MNSKEQGSSIYKTTQGDTWDLIAYKVYGDEKLATKLIENNKQFTKVVKFPSGVAIAIPKVMKTIKEEFPPWMLEE